MTKYKLGRKGFVFAYLSTPLIITEGKSSNQAETWWQELMQTHGEWWLLACSSWLVQVLS